MFIGEKLRKKDKGEPNLELEEKYNFGILSFDNLRFFMKVPWNPLQVIFTGLAGGVFGALSADFFRDSEEAQPIFNFWAYTVISHLHMPIFLNNLLCQVIEADHYTNTWGSSFYHGRYQIIAFMYLIVLIVWEGWTYSTSTILTLRWITFFLPLGFFIGLLPPLIPFLMYLIGMLNIHILGTSESGSILKTFLRFACWTLMSFLISLIFLGNDRATIILTCFFAFLFSNELMYKLPINTASKIPKEIKT